MITTSLLLYVPGIQTASPWSGAHPSSLAFAQY
ncbi:hypothetical protein RCH11_001064 [Glaciihabitans sp. GrIS 2.15]|nr:hypothetical protein [Glaciihabitans sp. GrIS 2.15]